MKMDYSGFLFPKGAVKKVELSAEQKKRLIAIHPIVMELDDYQCVAFWLLNHNVFLQNKLEMIHIIGRNVRHPEFDEPWNLMMGRKFFHDWCDGRGNNPLGITHIEYKIYALEQIKKVHPDTFRHERALQLLKLKVK